MSKFTIPFYVWSIDDIATAVPSNITIEIFNIFNLFHSRLQFTAEIGWKIWNFLDVAIINNNNILEFD